MKGKKILIVYFSGTGGTKKVADCFEKVFYENKHHVDTIEIRHPFISNSNVHDLLILLYPVYAGRAPKIVYDWINHTKEVSHTASVVISVSGGGEISPNTACRVKTKKLLAKKGYLTFYENMIIMPSNCIIKTKEDLAIRLLNILPKKVSTMANQILNKEEHLLQPKLIDRILLPLLNMQYLGGKSFGKHIKVNDHCNGCRWCHLNCPNKNIEFINDKPSFNNQCLLCLKCIYGCPQQALEAGKFRSLILKEGYSLNTYNLNKEDLQPIERLAKGYLWKGVKTYLEES